ncbi:hypothetical protein J7L48_10915, partial [bacterium]|nr:hypothetical protein [bacterium]
VYLLEDHSSRRAFFFNIVLNTFLKCKFFLSLYLNLYFVIPRELVPVGISKISQKVKGLKVKGSKEWY